MLVGLGFALIASILFGSIFVPIKKCNPRDGFTSQLFLCTGGFLVSVVTNAVVGFAPVYPLAMVGGMLWCVANAFAVQIMNRLGMALGILVWNTLSCLTGWATSRYGLFGIPASVPKTIILNYIGIIILIIGGIIYIFIKSNVTAEENEKKDEELGKQSSYEKEKSKNTKKNISVLERAVSLLCAMASGLFYGSMLTPVNYIRSHSHEFPNAPSESLPYLLSFFLGALGTSIFIFSIYIIFRRIDLEHVSEVMGPSMLAGMIFGFAMAFFFLAIEYMDAVVAYPVCAMAPGLVVSSWSVLYFKEITGRRNILILSVAYSFTLLGVAMVAISKDYFLF